MDNPYEIVILSGKGGTGKTSIAAAFASLAGNAIVTDCDVDAADLHLLLAPGVFKEEPFASGAKAVVNKQDCTLCGLCAGLCRFDAITFIDKEVFIDEWACEGCRLCSLACPAGAITLESYENNRIYFGDTRFGLMIYGKLGIAEENSGKLVSQIRQYAQKAAREKNAGLIITDGPPGIGCPVISSVTGADLIVAVTEPTLSGWHDLERLIELTRKLHSKIMVIVNKYDLNEEMSFMIEKNLEKMDIGLLGRIPYDVAVINALVEGITIREYDPEGRVSATLDSMWAEIMECTFETRHY